MDNNLELDKLILAIKPEDVIELKKELIQLFDREVYERGLYFMELRKFDGNIFQTIKWLSEQESTHANVLMRVLARGDIIAKEPEFQYKPLKASSVEIIKMNVEGERKAILEYTLAINKTKSIELKKVLDKIMSEEFDHIRRLSEFTGEA
jgi:hypothetical protein